MNAKDKHKILEWYCREGFCGKHPNCDTRCIGGYGTNPCFNYKILAQMLGIRKETWITVKEK